MTLHPVLKNIQVNAFILERFSKPLDEDIVDNPALSSEEALPVFE
jgi:hypothetical protein